MKRIIIGVIGNSINKNKFLDICKSNGFHTIKILDKVRELAGYLFELENENELDVTTLSSIRDRGYRVNKLYWINLILSSMNNDYKHVLLEDMQEEDCVNGIMKVYRADTIDGMTLADMEKDIHHLIKK